jgi:hypothetical protein
MNPVSQSCLTTSITSARSYTDRNRHTNSVFCPRTSASVRQPATNQSRTCEIPGLNTRTPITARIAARHVSRTLTPLKSNHRRGSTFIRGFSLTVTVQATDWRAHTTTDRECPARTTRGIGFSISEDSAVRAVSALPPAPMVFVWPSRPLSLSSPN